MQTIDRGKKLKRVSFLINTSHYNLLKKVSSQKGITFSSLIRTYLKNPSVELPRQNKYLDNSKQTKNLTLRISNEEWFELVSKSTTSNLSTSDLIRITIINNLNNNHDRYESKKLLNKKLLSLGRYKEYLETIGSDLGFYSLDDLLVILMVCIDICDFEKATKLIEYINKKLTLNKDTFSRLKLKSLEVDFFINSGNLKDAQNYLTVLQNDPGLKYFRGILGLTYIQQAEIVGYADHFDLAFTYFQKALDYLDVKNFPAEMIRVYVRYPLILAFESNFVYAKRYLEKLHEIVRNYKNNYYQGWYNLATSIISYLENNLQTAHDTLDTALKYFSVTGAKHEIYYCNDLLGRIFVSMNEYKKARPFLIQAIEMLPPHAPSYSILFKLFIDSKNNYEKSLLEVEKFIKNFPEFCPNMTLYIYHSIKYLHGKNTREIQSGKKGLTELIQNSKYKLIKIASQNTIKTNTLYPIR